MNASGTRDKYIEVILTEAGDDTVVDDVNKSAEAASSEGRTKEHTPREPIIPQSPRIVDGDRTFVVLSSPVATVPAKKSRRSPRRKLAG